MRFEYTSRGDRVSGRLLLPPGRAAAARPLALVGHGAGGVEGRGVPRRGRRPRGCAPAPPSPRSTSRSTASARARSSPSASSRASRPAPTASRSPSGSTSPRQAVVDLERALDALALHPEVDVGRTVYAGFSLGTILGALFCAGEPRVRAAALAIGGGGIGPEAADPARHIARFAPRPVLFVNATRDERIPRERAEALHAAAARAEAGALVRVRARATCPAAR